MSCEAFVNRTLKRLDRAASDHGRFAEE